MESSQILGYSHGGCAADQGQRAVELWSMVDADFGGQLNDNGGGHRLWGQFLDDGTKVF